MAETSVFVGGNRSDIAPMSDVCNLGGGGYTVTPKIGSFKTYPIRVDTV